MSGSGIVKGKFGNRRTRRATLGRTRASCSKYSVPRCTGACLPDYRRRVQCLSHILRNRSILCCRMQCGTFISWNKPASSRPRSAAASAFASTTLQRRTNFLHGFPRAGRLISTNPLQRGVKGPVKILQFQYLRNFVKYWNWR